jgi:hypothetical protein
VPADPLDEIEALRNRVAWLTSQVEAHQIADWIRFVPPHLIPQFLGQVASAAVEGELDGDPSALAGVLTDWIAVAEGHALGEEA